MRPRILIALAVVAAVVAVMPRASDAAREKIAILGVEPRDEGDARAQARTASLAHALTDALRQRAALPGTGYDIAPGSQKELLELKLLADCIDEAPECMTAIGRDLGADIVLFGNIERRNDGTYSVWLRSLVTTTKKAGPHSLVKTLTMTEATDETMRKLGAQVFPDVPLGSQRETVLIVETNVDEGTISVNGVSRGVITPKKATVIRGLPPGEARVTIESPGHAGASTTVDIKEGEPVRATLSLSPSAGGGPVQLEPVTDTGSPGKTSRVLFWTSLVATGAGVAAFTITGLQVRSIEKEQDEALGNFNYASNGIQHPNDACAEAEADGYTDLVDICKRGRRMATITNVLIGVTAATAVATAIFYWRGYLAPSRSERADRRRNKKDATRMVIGPELYQNGAGLGALIQF